MERTDRVVVFGLLGLILWRLGGGAMAAGSAPASAAPPSGGGAAPSSGEASPWIQDLGSTYYQSYYEAPPSGATAWCGGATAPGVAPQGTTPIQQSLSMTVYPPLIVDGQPYPDWRVLPENLDTRYVIDAAGRRVTVVRFLAGWLINGCPLNVIYGEGWLPGQQDALRAAGLTQCL